MDIYDSIFGAPIISELVRGFGKNKSKMVRHRQTCPDCGRKLVNLYKVGDNIWTCSLCRDKVIKQLLGLTKK